jgi:hypothetical protein
VLQDATCVGTNGIRMNGAEAYAKNEQVEQSSEARKRNRARDGPVEEAAAVRANLALSGKEDGGAAAATAVVLLHWGRVGISQHWANSSR